MGQQRRPGPVTQARSGDPGGAPVTGIKLARAVVTAALLGSLAACGGASGQAGGSSTQAGSASRIVASRTSAGTGSQSAARFTDIVEPFDPGHPARSRPAPASCGSQPSTLAIEECYQARTENTDAAIDAVQRARYDVGSPSQRAAILADDSGWLSARQPVCTVAFHSGGTTDKISVVACLLDESSARLNGVKGINPPVAMLKATDNADPSALAWYTTPGGSRIAMLDTQGDQSGGTIISWMIIGGAAGFTVNASQFYFRDGSFTDPGVPQAPNPAWHRVLSSVEYQFAVDYSHLSADPSRAKGTGGYVYAPGAPAASWR
jgi:uncharacterized protein YecT (DUF1311 family)